MNISAKQLKLLAWCASGFAAVTAVIAWGSALKWQLFPISSYVLFPIFGLLAFSLMWSHYIVAVARTHFDIDSSATKQYFEATSWVVLGAILLHPSILIYQLWRDGLGLPPISYLNYVAPSMKWVVALGSFSFFIFLAYEFRRKFGKKPWWKFVQYASDVAMVAIFYHGLRLGSNTQTGWFRAVWLFYGVTLVASLVYIYYTKLKTKSLK